MNILVVLAHPDPGSFNHALANAAAHTARRLGTVAQRNEWLSNASALVAEAFPGET